jgi:hypothetical protein
MDKLVKPVRELDAEARKKVEEALGTPLADDSSIVVQPIGPIPDLYRVYRGLSDEEIDELEKIILNRDDFDRAEE